MPNLNDEDLKKLEYNPKICGKYVDLSIGSFYAKYYGKDEMLKELFGKKIADIVGIKCPNYYIVSDCKCIISENLNTNQNFFFADKLEMDGTTLRNIAECLEFQKASYNRFTNVQELMQQVYIMHFIDIIFSNIDRGVHNFGFILNPDNTGTLVVIDNGDMFDHFNLATRPLSFEKASNLDYTAYSKATEFKCFISKVNPELLKLFEHLLIIFETKKVKLILDTIERENNMKFSNKREILKNYKTNYKGLSKNLKKDLSLIRKK